MPVWFSDLRPLAHLLLHPAVPSLVAVLAYRQRWLRAWSVMVATMLVDLDHLLAARIYDPGRCGIGFHPLHSYPAIAGYAALSLVPPRLIAVGVLLHMALDALDCLWLRQSGA